MSAPGFYTFEIGSRASFADKRVSDVVHTERREIHFSGRVQGVGFRYTARNIAARHQVSGFVQNLPDGRVWMIVEGPAAEIDRFLGEVRGELRRFIQGEQSASHSATGEFADFSIRH